MLKVPVQSLDISYSDLIYGECIGKGGFGIVYKCTYHGAQVAIKQLQIDNLSPEAEREFTQEASVMARMHHPNVVRFLGYCTVPRCLVMEYMPQGSLYSVLHKAESLEWTIRMRIVTDIASGLAFLHSKKIFHRDIKSLNVLLDNQYQAKLTDFGLSRIKDETRTALKTKQDVGTTRWMAPELFRIDGEPTYTYKCDIFSLGITFWEVAARKLPYANRDQATIPYVVTEGGRDVIPPDCPEKLASLIQQCCKANPKERPTAAEIISYMHSDAKTFTPSYKNDFRSLSPASVPPHSSEQKDSSPPVVLSVGTHSRSTHRKTTSRGSREFYVGMACVAGIGAALLVASNYIEKGEGSQPKRG